MADSHRRRGQLCVRKPREHRLHRPRFRRCTEPPEHRATGATGGSCRCGPPTERMADGRCGQHRQKATLVVDEALWALGRGTGITALVFLTVSMILGIVTRSGRALPGLPRFGVQNVHRAAALIGVILVVVHMLALLADPYAQLKLRLPLPGQLSCLLARTGHPCVRCSVRGVLDRTAAKSHRQQHFSTRSLERVRSLADRVRARTGKRNGLWTHMVSRHRHRISRRGDRSSSLANPDRLRRILDPAPPRRDMT